MHPKPRAETRGPCRPSWRDLTAVVAIRLRYRTRAPIPTAGRELKIEAHGTTVPAERGKHMLTARPSLVVFASANNDKAIVVLNQ